LVRRLLRDALDIDGDVGEFRHSCDAFAWPKGAAI
jgi:hypothetical protein